jgi:hypoxanthine phosphoribosyltransferase
MPTESRGDVRTAPDDIPPVPPVPPTVHRGFVHHLDEAALGDVVVSEERIRARIVELGAQITTDYVDHPPLLVCVLKGAFVFLADLARAIRLPLEVDFMAVSSYGASTRSSGVVRIVKDLDIDLAGRHVILVEDIVDSGLTLTYLRRNLAARQPASLEVCALFVRQGNQKTHEELRYVCEYRDDT